MGDGNDRFSKPLSLFEGDKFYCKVSGKDTEGDLYTMSFSFENGETLQLSVTKKTSDYNYHFPGDESGNQLVSATFNGNELSLKESSISIQPRQDDNKLNVVTNMHTLNAGDFNGTLTRIPLVGN